MLSEKLTHRKFLVVVVTETWLPYLQMNGDEESKAPSELARVLDAANAVHINGNGLSNRNDDDVFDDEELQNQAREEEKRRAAFDAVLEKSSAEWSKVSDPTMLRDALVRVLDQIRGPVVETVGPPREDEQCTADVRGSGTNGTDAHGDTDMEIDNDEDKEGDSFMAGHLANGLATTNGATKKQNGRVSSSVDISETFLERAKYIPLRLSHDERKVLRLVEAALNVSTYTDGTSQVNNAIIRSRARRDS